MNGGLIGGILLMAYSIYSMYQAKTDGLEWTPLLNVKVWCGGLVGIGTIIFHLKDFFLAYWNSLPGLKKVDNKIIVDKIVEPVDDEPIDKFSEFELDEFEAEDLASLTYLTKRSRKENNETAITLLKTLHDTFFDIHSKPKSV